MHRNDKIPLESTTKQIAKGGGIAFVGQTVGKFLTLLLQILLTRVLGPIGYGLYALGYSVLGILNMISMLGLHNGVIRFGAIYHGKGDKTRLKGTLLSAIVLSFTASWVFALSLHFLAEILAERLFHEPGLTAPLGVFAFALPFFTLTVMISYSTRALRRVDYDMAISQFFRPLLTLIVVGVSFFLGYRLMGAVTGFLISTVLSAGLGIYLLYRLFPKLFSKLKAHYEMKTLLLYSLTVLLVGLSYLLITRSDRIMLGILTSARDVGIYNAAAVLTEQATIFLTSFNIIFSPIIADLFHKDRMKELEILFKITTKWIFILTLPFVLIFVLFTRPLMTLFGAEFSGGSLILIILGLSQLINASTGPAGYILIMSGRQKVELMNTLALGSLNLILNFFLISKYGVLGAGIATGISIVFINMVRLTEIYLLYRMHPYKVSYWKPILAGVVGTLSCIGLKSAWNLSEWMWTVGIGLFVVMYSITFLAFKLDIEDKLMLKTLKMRVLGLRSGRKV